MLKQTRSLAALFDALHYHVGPTFAFRTALILCEMFLTSAQCDLLLPGPICLKGMLCVLGCTSAYLGFNNLLFEFLLPCYRFEPLWPPSPVPWHRRGTFLPTDPLLTGYSLFFRLKMVIVENPRGFTVSENWDQLIKSPFFYILMLSSLQLLLLTMSTCLVALSCCHVIGWLYICNTKQFGKCT